MGFSKALTMSTWMAILLSPPAFACSMFSIVSGDQVLMGNNEDYIKPGYVWFDPARPGRLGRVNFGFRDGFAQGGMNEKGLVFDAAVVGEVPYEADPNRPSPKNLIEFIMNTCGTVEDAIHEFREHNCTHLAKSQFMFADATGAAAVIAWLPDTGLSVVRRESAWLLNTNTRLEASGFRCERYVLAQRILEGAKQPGVEAAKAALDAMHQEGAEAFTSYSNIYDLKARRVHVYNLANFDEVVTFDLDKELAEGKNRYALAKIFEQSPSLRTVRNRSPRKFDTRITLESEQLARFVGRYSIMEGTAVVGVEVDGNGLKLIPPEGNAAHLFPESETKFRIVEGGQVTFDVDATGTVRGFTIHRNGDHRADKLPGE